MVSLIVGLNALHFGLLWIYHSDYVKMRFDLRYDAIEMCLNSAIIVCHALCCIIAVHRCSKFGQEAGKQTEVLVANLSYPMDVKVVHPLRQPSGESPCSKHNCSHICFSNLKTFSCACPDGLTLLADNRTCSQCMYYGLVVLTLLDDKRRQWKDSFQQA